ncbi:Ig-like domain-containing protein [uncultured Roseivirga sp.]|uniref:Ig-like domain-containing protein n=1 Tax=uncultured Roseivirga sp. TaxID=543088 RepID=UPI0030DCE224
MNTESNPSLSLKFPLRGVQLFFVLLLSVFIFSKAEAQIALANSLSDSDNDGSLIIKRTSNSDASTTPFFYSGMDDSAPKVDENIYISSFTPYAVPVPVTVIDFTGEGWSNSQNLGASLTRSDFVFSHYNSSLVPAAIYASIFGEGFPFTNPDWSLRIDKAYLVIKKTDGSEFDFQSLYAVGVDDQTVSISGYRNTKSVATTSAATSIYGARISPSALDGGFANVDSVVVSNPNGILDTFNFAPPTDQAPPDVKKILVAGTPSGSATSIIYTVSFYENANNLSIDDFQLTKTGTAQGIVSSLSASSGTSVIVIVNSVSGDGTLRLDLKSNTNIIDDLGNGNNNNGYVQAYTGGVTHTTDFTNPVFTSAATANFAENGSGTAYTAVATDANTVTYSLGNAKDEALFNIVGATGVVTFKNAPDFENPTDGNTDNAYVINVIANDGTHSVNQDVTITVTDIDEINPVFTSATTANFAENGTGTAYTVVATDANTVTYSLGNAKDEALFNIVGTTGVVTFKNAPDYENPADGNTDNAYVINVIASDGRNSVNQNVTITVTDIDEINPVFISATTANFAENGTGTAYTVVATDANTVTYSLGNAKDEALFNIVGTTGVVTFKNAPDYENPADGNTDNAYVINVIASDGRNSVNQNVTITVTDIDEINPVFTSVTTANFAENGTGTAYTVVATDANTVTYSLGNAKDEALFNIVGTTGVVTFKNAPDYENPADGNTDNAYVINVIASDGRNSVNQNVTITVTDIDEINPVFTSATTANFAENGTGTAYTAVATDANTITYSLGNAKDEALFNIVGATGVVTFKSSPNFESPKDADANNTYIINVIASDGRNSVNQDVTITVTNVNEAPSITSTAVTAVNDNETYSYKIATSDLDNDVVTVSATTKPNWLTLKLIENEVSNLAGTNNYASVDGTGLGANFYMPDDIVLDASGNMYVSDFGSNKIRKITPIGVVTTLAGSGVTGSANGNGLNASFNHPRGLAIDATGNVFVADRDNNVIRKITPSGDVTTYAGSGAWGSTNGASGNARFNSPNGVAVDASGNLFVTDGNNNLIRKIDTNGNVSSFASVANPFGIAIDAASNLYVTDRDNNLVHKIASNGVVTTLAGTGVSGSADGPGLSASFNYPSGITVDASGNVYVADKSNNKIRKIAPNGEVTTVAFVADATGIAVDASGVMYASTGRNRIKKISNNYLLSGSAEGHAGKHNVILSASDGNGATAIQSYVVDVSRVLTPDANNILYVNKNVSGGNNRGGSWANAVTELADALVWAKENYDNAWATTPLKIFVAKGTYKPLYSPEDGVKFGTDQGRDNSFLMVNNVQIYGGFDPDNGIDDLTDSRILPSTGSTGTILSGDVNDDDGSDFANNSENSIRVIVSSGDVGKALLNGFTITGANGENNNNITVNGNPVYQCSGAGIYNAKSSPTYENLLLYGNHNTESGGGMFSYQSSPKVRNSIFRNNKAKDGGAMANQDNSSPILTNVIFIQNQATADGGAIYNVDSSTPTFVNITVVGNTDTGGGDGIYNSNHAISALYNSIIWDVVHGIYTAQNSLIKGRTDTDYGNLDATGVTNASIFTDYANGDYSLKHNSPAVDAGSNALYTSAGGDIANDVDFAGNPRLYDGPSATDNIDLGVYEYHDIINPVLTSLTTANFEENGTGTVYTVTATDANTITYSLGNANDEALFNIIGSTGVVTFKSAPDFENPTDGDANNTYVINVIASDGKNAVNQNVTITVTDIDEIKPTVTVTSASTSPHSGAFDITVTFSESVTGFVISDLTVANGTASNFAGSRTTYTATITPSTDGLVTVDVAAGVAQDAASNTNTAATQFSITNDETKPTVTITSASTSPNSGAFDITVTFSESVTGFVVGDLTVGNGTASNFAGSGTTYTATITPSADGVVTVNVAAGVAQDAAANTNIAATQFSITNDETKPTVTVTSASTSPHSGAFDITVTFSESVTGFVVGDLTVANGTASNFAGSGTTYTATITPSTDGLVTVNVAAGVAQDAASNTNTAATQLSITNDETKPTVTITSASTSPHSGAFDITVTFSESVTGFVIGDLTVANGTASNFAGSGTTYTATITPSADGVVTVDVAAGVAQDAASNTNTAATQFSITNDETKPSVTITSTSTSPTSGAFNVTITFSESVTGFVIGDLTVDNGIASNFTGTGTTYTATITPSADGAVTVNVAAGVAQDAASNTNTAATQFSITNDETKPSVTITSTSTSPTSGAFNVTITFSESVTGFVNGDLTVDNGIASNFTGSGTTYTATITPSADGAVTLNVAAGVAQDAASNTNTAATQFSIINDQTKPSVSLTAGSSNPVAGLYSITAQFSEGVIGFSLDDIIVVGGTASSFVVVDADTYTFSVTSTNSSATVNIEEGVAIDVVGNYNTASNSLSLVFNLAPNNLMLSNTSVSENNSIGQLIGNLSTTDADATDTHTYSLVSGTGGTDNASFTVVGNKLQAAEIFDFEIKTSYSIRIKTDDGRGGTYEKQFTISITNIEEPEVRIESDYEIPATALGLTSNFDITIHNDGDALLMVNSVLYPNGFVGLVTGLFINPGESKVVTLGFMPTEAKVYTGTISFITNAGTVSMTVSGEGAIITGVDDGFIDAEEINLFPNPAQDILNIDLSELGSRALDISIINASGTSVFTKIKVTEKSLRLNVSDYTNGLYIVQFTDGISVVRKKVMIKR